MKDRMPLWALAIRMLGFNVEQEFQVLTRDREHKPFVLHSGLHTRRDAYEACWGHNWVRRVIHVWKDLD
jgi:hypothetical protein